MNDIEDTAGGSAGASGMHLHSAINPRERRKHSDGDDRRHGVDVPGDATIFVHTFGCGHNVSDGEYMAGLLADRGYRITDEFSGADCYLINSCTVKNPSEDHFVTMLKKARNTGKPVVVAGCVPQGDPNGKEWADVSIVGVQNIHQVTDVVQEALRGNTARLLSSSATIAPSPSGSKASTALPQLNLPKIRRNKCIEIIPINVGCLNNCTYCKTKHARGDLQSWPVEAIVDRVVQVVAEGVREIRLTSEDVGAYGIDIGTNIVALLQKILQAVEGTDVMIRVGMSNPPYLLKHVDAFAQLLLHPNAYEFVHIPVQSGSDAILDLMKREYTVAEFTACVDGIRAVVPNVSIATDIICAFPGEGDSEWKETVALCDKIRFPILNISRFYARRGTPAAGMPQIRTDVAKKRTVELTALYNSYTTYNHLVGSTHWVTLLEVAHDQHHLVGHTKAYVQVLVDPAAARIGDIVKVKITAATKYSVNGDVLEKRDFCSFFATRPTDSSQRIGKKAHARHFLCAHSKPLLAFVCGCAAVAAILHRWRRQ